MRARTSRSRGPTGPFVSWSPADQAFAAQAMIAASHLNTFDLPARNLILLAQFVVDIQEGCSPSPAALAEVGRMVERY